MIKIEWTAGKRRVPGIGIINTGDVRDVNEDIGQAGPCQKAGGPEKGQGRRG